MKIDLYENRRRFDHLSEQGYEKVTFNKDGQTIIEITASEALNLEKDTNILVKSAYFIEIDQKYRLSRIHLKIPIESLKKRLQETISETINNPVEVDLKSDSNQFAIMYSKPNRPRSIEECISDESFPKQPYFEKEISAANLRFFNTDGRVSLFLTDLLFVGMNMRAQLNQSFSFLSKAIGVEENYQKSFKEDAETSIYEWQLSYAEAISILNRDSVWGKVFDNSEDLVIDDKCQLTTSFADDGIELIVSETDREVAANPHSIPLTLLEAREVKRECMAHDAVLMKEGLDPNMKVDSSANSEVRLVKDALGSANISVEEIESLTKALDQYETSVLLCASLKVSKDVKLKDNEKFLEDFSSFVELIIANYGQVESLKGIIANGLGFGWLRVDLEKSLAAFNLGMECSSQVEHLHLLRSYACHRFNANIEAMKEYRSWLEKTSSVICRQFILSKMLQTSKLIPEDLDETDSIANALLKIDPAFEDAIDFKLNHLFDKNQKESAIQILSIALKHLNKQERYHEASSLELKLADIWQQLGRIDIAEQRVRASLEKDSTNESASEMLVNLLRQGNNTDKLLEHYYQKFESIKSEGDTDKVSDARDTIFEIYESDDSLKLIFDTKLIFEGLYQLKWIEEVHAWNSDKATWSKYIDALFKSVNSPNGRCFAPAQLTVIIDVVANRVQDRTREADLLYTKLESTFDREDLEKVERSFHERKKYAELVNIYRNCMDKVEDDDTKQLLMNKMLAVPHELTEDDRDSIVLNLLQIDQGNETPIKKRLELMIQAGDWKRFFDVSIRALRIIQFHFKKAKWLRDLIALVDNVEGASNTQLRLYKFLLDLENEEEVALTILEKFSEQHLNPTVQSAAQHLIHAGKIPPVSEDGVCKILEGKSKDLALFYELKALSASNTTERTDLFYKAYTYNKQRLALEQKSNSEEEPAVRAKVEFCLQRCLERGGYLEEFSFYRELVEQSENFLAYVNTLLSALKSEQGEKITKDEILFGLNYLKSDSMLNNRLLELSQTYIDRFGPETEVVVLLSSAYEKSGQNEKEIEFIKQVLSDKKYEKVEQKSKFMYRLKKLGEVDFLKDYVDEKLKNGSKEDKAPFLEMAIDLDIVAPVQKSDSFEIALNLKDEGLIEKSWFSMISDLDGKSVAKEFFEHSREAILGLDMKDLWNKLLSSIPSRLSLDVDNLSSVKEVYVQSGVDLFEADQELKVAEKILGAVFELDKNETRVWMPYYLVLRKNENTNKLLPLLEFIIPKVSRNLSILKSYPITVESLENELIQMGDQQFKKVSGGYESTNIPAPNVSQDTAHDLMDWRDLVVNRKITKGLSKKLNIKALASALEKHVALQAVTLLSGEFDFLKQIRSRVWRDVNQYDYPLDGRGRYPSGFTHKSIGSTFHQLVGSCVPAFAIAFKDRFSISYVANRIGCDARDIMKYRNPLRWDSAFLPQYGFKYYQEKLDKQRYVVFDLPGLKEEIFFDGSQRSFYFDASYYQKKPLTHLFHRIMFLTWSLKFNYYVPLTLNVRDHLLPFFDELTRRCDQGILGDLRNKIVGPSNQFDLAFQKVDLESCRQQLDEIGGINPAMIYDLRSGMDDHIARLQLSETLDLVGIIEALSDLDLESSDEMKLYQILDAHDAVENLIVFACHLKV